MYEIHISDSESSQAPPVPQGNQSEIYKEIITKQYESLVDLQDVKWEATITENNIKVFTFGDFVKVEAFLRCSSHKLFMLIKDNSIVTRGQWDEMCPMDELTVLEEYPCDENNGHIYIVDFNLKTTWYQREFIGIQWIRKRDLMTIFKTIPTHPVHHVKPGRVQGDLFFASWIENMDEEKSYVTQIYQMNLNGWIKRTHIDPYVIVQRLFLMERVANSTKLYMEIYTPWKCHPCNKMIPPHELDCRHCTNARYTRCPDMACMEAQRKLAKVCWKCHEKL